MDIFDNWLIWKFYFAISRDGGGGGGGGGGGTQGDERQLLVKLHNVLSPSNAVLCVANIVEHWYTRAGPGNAESMFHRQPNRIAEFTATLIDHMFVKWPRSMIAAPIKAGILFNDITNHLPIFLLMSTQQRKQSSKQPTARIFSDKNIQKFVDELSTVNWNQVLNHNNGNQDCSEFYKYFDRIYCESFPLVQISRKRYKDKPWITKGLLISILHKNRLYKESILNPNDSNIHRYNTYKNHMWLVKKGRRSLLPEYSEWQEKFSQKLVEALWSNFE